MVEESPAAILPYSRARMGDRLTPPAKTYIVSIATWWAW